MRGAPRIGAALLALGALVLAGCARLIGGEAGVVLAAIEHGPARTELGRVTPPPSRQRLPEADLWLPAGRAATAAIVLAPGFAEAGRDDPRLLPLAESLARAGFAVRVPELPGARRLTLDPVDIAAMRAAAAAERAAGRRVALGGISFAAAPALLAGQEGAELVVTLGGFHDMASLAIFALTGAHRAPGEPAWRREAPNGFAAGGFLLAVADALPEAGDRARLRLAGWRRLADVQAPLGDLGAGMGEAGRAVLALAAETDPDAVPARLAALPEPVRAALAALDPSRAALATCTLAIHGLADPVIPWTQSAALAAALPAGRAVLVTVPGFGHVEPAGVPPAGQAALLRAMRLLLGWRDGALPCAAG